MRTEFTSRDTPGRFRIVELVRVANAFSLDVSGGVIGQQIAWVPHRGIRPAIGSGRLDAVESVSPHTGASANGTRLAFTPLTRAVSAAP
jgi:hypothetical protein